jgi:hypothetical protein
LTSAAHGAHAPQMTALTSCRLREQRLDLVRAVIVVRHIGQPHLSLEMSVAHLPYCVYYGRTLR